MDYHPEHQGQIYQGRSSDATPLSVENKLIPGASAGYYFLLGAPFARLSLQRRGTDVGFECSPRVDSAGVVSVVLLLVHLIVVVIVRNEDLTGEDLVVDGDGGFDVVAAVIILEVDFVFVVL